MYPQSKSVLRLSFLSLSILAITGCAAGNPQFSTEGPAGFWYGLWHGMISFIALVVQLFDETVRVYEIHNSGGWYDFGFLLGILLVWGGGSHVTIKTKAQTQREKEWEEIGDKVERKIMRKLKEWSDDAPTADKPDEWDEISDKVEKKVKRKLREWADKE